MKKSNPDIEKARVRVGPFRSNESYGMNGFFRIRGPNGLDITCMVSDGGGWDHVSFEIEPPPPLTKQRMPRWEEVCFVKDFFFEEDEVAIQIHPAKKNYINVHPFVLHLWRPQDKKIPLPPLDFV